MYKQLDIYGNVSKEHYKVYKPYIVFYERNDCVQRMDVYAQHEAQARAIVLNKLNGKCKIRDILPNPVKENVIKY